MVRQELSAETNLEGNGRGLLQGTSEVRLETLITTECQKGLLVAPLLTPCVLLSDMGLSTPLSGRLQLPWSRQLLMANSSRLRCLGVARGKACCQRSCGTLL